MRDDVLTVKVVSTLILICTIITSCSPEPTAPSAVLFPLPAVADYDPACRGVGFEERAVLHGDPNDPRLTWLEFGALGRVEIIWPRGYSASFVNGLAVVDARGREVLRDGAVISGGCVTPDVRTYLLIPPFS
jgi:hypothetical protein